MSNLLRFSLIFTFLVLCIPSVDAADKYRDDKIRTRKAELSIVRNGQNIPVNPADEDIIVERVVDLFNQHVTQTQRDGYLKQKMERDGVMLADKWNTYKDHGSYFSLKYKKKKRSKYYEKNYVSTVKKVNRADIEEVLVTFEEDENNQPYGVVLSKIRDTGEVRGYEINTSTLTSLYCYDDIIKYLPEKYTKMNEKYGDPALKDSGVSCNEETDAYLEEKEAKRKAKKAKWARKKGPYGTPLPEPKKDLSSDEDEIEEDDE